MLKHWRCGVIVAPKPNKLLVAESIQRYAERNMINAMYPITKLSVDDLLCKGGLSSYKELIDLSLKLLSPYCKNITN
jgi:hypothetical protein